ncbi:MAG: metallophosphoesterase [Christensenellales bacterium]|jgi:predicted phosphohydrolase
MNIYAIGDLHLPGNDQKPMEVFGEQWKGHWEKIKANWIHSVGPNDAVLIPGDISWAMRFEDALDDIQEIGKLSGYKVLMRGNHDYWWSAITRLRESLPEGMYALQNDHVDLGAYVIAGTRGWACPPGLSANDEKIYLREASRLELSLRSAYQAANGREIIVMMHYPPFNDKQAPSAFTDLIDGYGIQYVVYAHLHGDSLKNAFEGRIRQTEYMLVSCDYLGFNLKKVI